MKLMKEMLEKTLIQFLIHCKKESININSKELFNYLMIRGGERSANISRLITKWNSGVRQYIIIY